MRLDHLLSKETHLRETLRSVGRTSAVRVLLSFERIIKKDSLSLFFENCIEEGNERKIFHKKCFSDVPKEISKRLNRKVKKSQEGQGVNLTKLR